MKSLSLIGLASAGVVALSTTASATTAGPYDLLYMGSYGVFQSYVPYGLSTESLDITANGGALDLQSIFAESSPFAGDGGLYLTGRPVRVVLGGVLGPTEYDDGAFEIWGYTSAYLGGLHFPAMKVDTGAHTAAFKGVDVTIDSDGTNGGTLKVGGKAVLTQGNGPVAFGTATATGAYSFATGNSSTATGAYSFAIGNGSGASGTSSFAGGTGAHAVAQGSFAFGSGATAGSNVTAINAIAFGTSASATVANSMALGSNSTAGAAGSVALAGGTTSGISSIAGAGALIGATRSIGSGEGLESYSFSSAMFGLYNIYVGGNPTTWVGTDSLFTLGNGESDTLRSTAMVTLKNGQTNLTNKYWDSAHPVDPVTGATQSAGEALVVNGNTRLRGKVVLEQAQGDISMGIYTP